VVALRTGLDEKLRAALGVGTCVGFARFRAGQVTGAAELGHDSLHCALVARSDAVGSSEDLSRLVEDGPTDAIVDDPFIFRIEMGENRDGNDRDDNENAECNPNPEPTPHRKEKELPGRAGWGTLDFHAGSGFAGELPVGYRAGGVRY
jgi:hypothetical protein